jgi:hypothetical protein
VPSNARYDHIVRQLTREQRADLVRAIDEWRDGRDIGDALGPLRRALRDQARRELADLDGAPPDAPGGDT